MATPAPGAGFIPALPARSSPGDFFRGLRLPFKALTLITRGGKLFWLSALCAGVTLVTLVAVVALAATYTDDLVGWVWARPQAWYGAAVWYLLVVLAFLVLLAVGANTLPLLALTPLQDPVSEAAEETCGDFAAPPFALGSFLRGALLSLGHTLARVAVLMAGHALLFLLHFIPGVGSVAWTVLAGLWTALWMGAEYLAAPMARHFLPFSQVRTVVWRRLPLALGFGAAVYVILWVPVLNCFFIPMANVGGTLLYRGLVQAGDLPRESPANPTSAP